MSYFPAILAAQFAHLPLLVVWMVGIGIALARWSKHPRVSLLVVLALSGMLLLGVASTAISVVVPQYLYRQGVTTARTGVVFAIIGLVTATLSAGCWVMVIVALFSGRRAEK